MKISNKLYNNGCNNADAVFNHSLNGRYPMRIGKFQPPPRKSIHLNRSIKNLAQLITSARGPPMPNLVEIHPLGASGQMGEI